jgi:hypothetical protein
LKVADGAGRAIGPALAAFLAELGHPLERLATTSISNSRGEPVGDISAAR